MSGFTGTSSSDGGPNGLAGSNIGQGQPQTGSEPGSGAGGAGGIYRPDYLHETLNIYISQDTYVFEPASFPTPNMFTLSDGYPADKIVRETLTVDRRTGKMTLNATNSGPPLGGNERVITCFGIVGFISLATTDFILVITSRTPSCRLLGHSIYQANDFRLLPLSPLSTTSTILEHPVERELVALVEQGLRGGKLWFSYGWDLTNSLQRQYESAVEGRFRTRAVASEITLNTPMREKTNMELSAITSTTAPSSGSPTTRGDRAMWQRADDRFFWNKYLMTRMIEQSERGGRDSDLGRFILPLMYGSVELRSAQINNRDFLFCLIARRSRYRAGTRYFTRGIDQYGHCANYNETEQILLLDPLDQRQTPGRVQGKERLSFVQVRGSVPLFWAEVNNLRYKPDLQVMDIPQTSSALRYHLAEQLRVYDEVWLINLVNSKGYELPVKEAFEKAIAAANEPKAHYIYFDFHKECKGLRFDRIQLLIDSLADDIAKIGYFHVDTSSEDEKTAAETKRRQSGVVRTNCMDCLDRTNVAQAALAKDILQAQLRAVGILNSKESLDDHPDFMITFRNVWADHADHISNAYSGSGALKTDFTRTGKRTKEGALQDGINSLKRYVKNNFFDGSRQDAFDLLTGAWVARRGNIPPLSDIRPPAFKAMPYIFVISTLLVLTSLLFPQYTLIATKSYFYFSIWVLLAGLSFAFIWSHGTSYVNWPRLNPPYEILNYEGAGYRSKPRGRGRDSILSSFASLSRKPRMAAAIGIDAITGARRPQRATKAEEYEMGRRKKGLVD